MEHLMLISTVVDLAAVALLGWLLLHGSRERETALGIQQATLQSLRADLGQLVLEAERRAHGLEETLAAREQSLRAVLEDIDRVERAAARRRGSASAPLDDDVRDPRRRPAEDPAEARLLRDLQLSFGAREA